MFQMLCADIIDIKRIVELLFNDLILIWRFQIFFLFYPSLIPFLRPNLSNRILIFIPLSNF